MNWQASFLRKDIFLKLKFLTNDFFKDYAKMSVTKLFYSPDCAEFST